MHNHVNELYAISSGIEFVAQGLGAEDLGLQFILDLLGRRVRVVAIEVDDYLGHTPFVPTEEDVTN